MLKIMDGLDHQNKIERERILLNQLVNDLKEEEFMKNVEKLKELDFAEGLILQTLFDYKVRDEHDQVDLAIDVAKEYHSGKLDPQQGWKAEKKKRTAYKKTVIKF
jgi:hypothetical protein